MVKRLSVRLPAKWLCVRVPLQSVKYVVVFAQKYSDKDRMTTHIYSSKRANTNNNTHSHPHVCFAHKLDDTNGY